MDAAAAFPAVLADDTPLPEPRWRRAQLVFGRWSKQGECRKQSLNVLKLCRGASQRKQTPSAIQLLSESHEIITCRAIRNRHWFTLGGHPLDPAGG